MLPRQEGAVAVDLLARARDAGRDGVVFIAATAGRAERLARLLWALAPDVDALLFPPWDCMPFDRSPPSARVMGLRVATLSWLFARTGERPCVVLATAEALVQRVPPMALCADRMLMLAVGEPVDPAALGPSLEALGYRTDERVDEAGEYAIRGAVIDLFPAGYYLPVRIDHEEGRIAGIASFDVATQRTTDTFPILRVQPVSEAILPVVAPGEAPSPRPVGLEHRLPDLYERLETLLDSAPDAVLVLEPGAADRAQVFADQVRDAYDSRVRLDRAGERPLPPDRLYLDARECADRREARAAIELTAPEDADAPDVPVFALSERPSDALRRFLDGERRAGRRILFAGPDGRELDGLARRIETAAGTASAAVGSWDEVVAAEPGAVLRMVLPIRQGFRAEPGVTAVAVADVLGSRATATVGAVSGGAGPGFGEADAPFRIGDAVIHLDHGVGVLQGLETVESGPEGATDTIRLGYAGDTRLMVPVGEIELMWRYGAMRDGLSLDRLGGTSWPKRRAKVEVEIGHAAKALAARAEQKRSTEAPRLVPPRRDFERFVAGFPFTDTPDQHAAAADILRALASGRAMDRLVCGDVGFGKTEVALRAAAAALLAGKQVAVAAPTTVLVRQHLQTFAARFASAGIAVANLSRLVKPAEARQVKAGLASGEIRLVVGTQALAAKDVAFADLGLVVIDEEQRFGAADKERLRSLGSGVHVLTLTATPIPRTLQAALAGLQDVSILATPPAERLPVRTVVSTLDEATMREALLRESRRGGQSFVVCPRIEDIGPMSERLARIVPELETVVAHGKLEAAAIDAAMVGFADGRGDVLLATNIVESGLDVPRANTMMVWHADRFGLAQLHQLRGRVGRSKARGVAYLLTDPEEEIAPATLKRLETVASLDRLGAGFELSAEDLDSRGAGDLLGDTQAGHVKLIGAGLYRRLLERAMIGAQGRTPPEEWTPELHVGASGRIPAGYVPEAEVRINLYARIARSRDAATERRLAEEIEDRFGPLPEPVVELLTLARLRRLCRDAAIARVDAGPRAVALTFKEARPRLDDLAPATERWGETLGWKGERLVLEVPTDEGERPLLVEALVEAVADR